MVKNECNYSHNIISTMGSLNVFSVADMVFAILKEHLGYVMGGIIYIHILIRLYQLESHFDIPTKVEEIENNNSTKIAFLEKENKNMKASLKKLKTSLANLLRYMEEKE